jgi:hypothetical protein
VRLALEIAGVAMVGGGFWLFGHTLHYSQRYSFDGGALRCLASAGLMGFGGLIAVFSVGGLIP